MSTTSPKPEPLRLVNKPALRDHLIDAVLRGVKTATSELLAFYDMEARALPRPDARYVLLDGEDRPAGVIQLREIRVLEFGRVGDEIAFAEGDWFDSADAWRVSHARYWSQFVPGIREFLGDDAWDVSDDTPVVVRFFDVVERLI